MNPPRVYGVDKEVEIFNETQMQEMLDAWEIRTLIPWMEQMEKAIVCQKYNDCKQLLNSLQPYNIKNLPLNLSKLANEMKKRVQSQEPSYNVGENYLRLLREIKKFTMSFPLMSQDLIQARIQFMEQYLGSPLNQNFVRDEGCNCRIM